MTESKKIAPKHRIHTLSYKVLPKDAVLKQGKIPKHLASDLSYCYTKDGTRAAKKKGGGADGPENPLSFSGGGGNIREQRLRKIPQLARTVRQERGAGPVGVEVSLQALEVTVEAAGDVLGRHHELERRVAAQGQETRRGALVARQLLHGGGDVGFDLGRGQGAGAAVPEVVEALDAGGDDFVDGGQIRDVIGGCGGRVEVPRAGCEAGVVDDAVVVAAVGPFLKEVLFAGVEVEGCQVADERGDTDQELRGDDEFGAGGGFDEQFDAVFAGALGGGDGGGEERVGSEFREGFDVELAVVVVGCHHVASAEATQVRGVEDFEDVDCQLLENVADTEGVAVDGICDVLERVLLDEVAEFQ